jgi:hypothetical protein
MLNALKTSEKMAVSASKKADEIIQNIIKNGDSPLSDLGKFTRHGEFRIKNCIKYDIGKGYRMVCVKDDDRLYLLFVGTHDDCSAWVENNRNFIPDHTRKGTITYNVDMASQESETTVFFQNNEDYEEILLAKITERDLKTVFKGLVSGSQPI